MNDIVHPFFILTPTTQDVVDAMNPELRDVAIRLDTLIQARAVPTSVKGAWYVPDDLQWLDYCESTAAELPRLATELLHKHGRIYVGRTRMSIGLSRLKQKLGAINNGAIRQAAVNLDRGKPLISGCHCIQVTER